jgi:hypothetical protein
MGRAPLPRILAATAAGLLLAACGPARAATGSTPLQAAILARARRQARVRFRSCAVQWRWKLGPADGAAAFTCLGAAGALFAGVAYVAAEARAPGGLVALEVTKDDRATAFSEAQLAGLRLAPPPSGATAPQHYLIVAGVVNDAGIQAMTAVFSDGHLGMTTINSGSPRIYAFVNTGGPSTVHTITALGGSGQVLFTAPPFPPRAH